MDPYLEHPNHWPEVHYGLIAELQENLNQQITPRYRAAVEKRVYTDLVTVIVPDATVFERSPKASQRSSSLGLTTGETLMLSQPERVALPVAEEVTERFLEIREMPTGRVVTVIEVLSPKNKRAGEGRSQYLKKRQQILSSQSHFIEIDLLRGGEAMPLSSPRDGKDYQVLVSRVEDRPLADRYGFGLREPIPVFLLPLDEGATEPPLNLKPLLNRVYHKAALELEIDYGQQPTPELGLEDWKWVRSLPMSSPSVNS
jgi:hypothetical protein